MKEVWDNRYETDNYVYGTGPNDFLVQAAAGLPPGDALCLADGEGRNSVYLAELGHTSTAVDISEIGLEKAGSLASERGVDVTTICGDLAEFDLGRRRWDLIVSIFAHTPPPVRHHVHRQISTALRPGGRFVLEAYTPRQIGRSTGGPPVAELMMTLDGLRTELSGMTIIQGAETLRDITEGAGHVGIGAVVQVIATPNR